MKPELYDTRFPKPSNAIDLFAGEWGGDIPAFFAGRVKFYDDPKIGLWEDALGGFAGKRILELGPLEASHTYAMERRGAADILAIEANSHAFMRCLIVKDLLGMRAHFLLGDFSKFLKAGNSRFDIILASGVLYHMPDPLEVIENITRATDAVAVWTHYYDAAILVGHKTLDHKFDHTPIQRDFHGATFTVHEQRYLEALALSGFSGGTEGTSLWLTRSSLIEAFALLQFDVEVVLEEPKHVHGPAFAFVAKRKRL
jgi:SAM-dependent methyltransferase